MALALSTRGRKQNRKIFSSARTSTDLDDHTFAGNCMLECTFQHLDGIGEKREKALWENGILTWDDYDRKTSIQLKLFSSVSSKLDESRAAFRRKDADYFASRLPRSAFYRIAESFPEEILYLDIETTGLSRHYHEITIVGWDIGGRYGVWVNGEGQDDLVYALSQARTLVTFNGSIFDIPFLLKFHPTLSIPSCHIDLRFLAKRSGFSGGQKQVEQEIGFVRSDGTAELRGEHAPILWHKYRRGELKALHRLIEYNRADIEGMKAILARCVATLSLSDGLPVLVREDVIADRRIKKPSKTLPDFLKRLKPYSGKCGPKVQLRELLPENLKSRFVGIDLTGSEKRASGWCLLNGKTATTRRIFTDSEIVDATVESLPWVVSIDSPLSLPKGRTSVSDDDPMRREFGIMRRCERILKQRGINVYPSLINSMQALTARGIRIASALRRRGIPVIESYPGAAQDIMDIPRKKNGLDYLASGLAEFGVQGRFIQGDMISHDELDAITSAVVAAFFWAGRFEALGDHDEDYLIVPDVSVAGNSWSARQVIGLSGPIASGKTTAASHLRRDGFAYGRFSAIIVKLIRDERRKITRTEMQDLGQHINSEGRQRELGRRLLARLHNNTRIVVDGLRHPEDHSLLVETYGPSFLHVSITAPEDLCRARFESICDENECYDLVLSHPVERNIVLLQKLAHKTVVNDSSRMCLRERILKTTTNNHGG